MGRRGLVFAGILAALVLSGCATKQFVRGEFQQRDTHLGRLEADLAEERTRVGEVRAQAADARARAETAARRAEQAAGVGDQALKQADQAGARAEDARAKAEDARAKADEAAAKSDETDRALKRLWSSRNQRSVADSIVIHFRRDRFDLDDRAETALLQAVQMLEENPNALVTLEGYTDPSGPAPYNMQLSERRAEAVRRFMARRGVDLHRIRPSGSARRRRRCRPPRRRSGGRRSGASW